MNTPNPISPLSPLSQASRGRSNVRIAVISIIALHAVFFGGLLMQGCGKKDNDSLRNDLAGTNVTGTNDLAQLTNEPFGAATNTFAGTSSATASNVSWPTNAWVQPSGPTGYVREIPQPATPPAEGLTEYEIKKGDTPAKIARAHGISTTALMSANPGLDARKLQVKQKIKIPVSQKSGSVASAAGGTGTAADLSAGSESSYLVKPGDNLHKIAMAHGVTVPALRRANGLKTDRILVNQRLKIPAATVAPKPATTTTSAAVTPQTQPFNVAPASAVPITSPGLTNTAFAR